MNTMIPSDSNKNSDRPSNTPVRELLDSSQILSLIRYSIIASIAFSFLLVAMLYFILNLRLEMAIAGIVMFVSLGLSVAIQPKKVGLKRSLAFLGGSAPSITALVGFFMLSNPITLPMGIGMILGGVGGLGSFYLTLGETKGVGAEAFWTIEEKVMRVMVWKAIYESGWTPRIKDGIKFFDDLLWEIWREENDHEYTCSIHWWGSKKLPTISLNDKMPYVYALHQGCFELEDRIIRASFHLQRLKTLENFVWILSNKWQKAYVVVTSLKDAFADDQKLINLAGNWKESELISIVESTLESIAPLYNESLSIEREKQYLERIHDRYKLLLEEITEHHRKGDFTADKYRSELQIASKDLKRQLDEWDKVQIDEIKQQLKEPRNEFDQLIAAYNGNSYKIN